MGSLPVAEFTIIGDPIYTGISYTLDASASNDPDGTITTYEIDINNDGVYDSSSGSPTTPISFGSPGEKTIWVKVTDNDGATDEISHIFTVVANPPPVAIFTWDEPVYTIGTRVYISGIATSDSLTITI